MKGSTWSQQIKIVTLCTRTFSLTAYKNKNIVWEINHFDNDY